MTRAARTAAVLLLILCSTPAVFGQSFTFTTFAGPQGGPGFYDGSGSAARFNGPFGAVADAGGNIYVADSDDNSIRKITPQGAVTTLAGLSGATSGTADGSGSAARFNSPRGIGIDGSGNLYVADYGNHTIRKITPDGNVTTLAGLGGTFGSDDGTGSAARFHFPQGVATDSAGNVYVDDVVNCTIRKITPAGVVSTIAGVAGTPGNTDGTGSGALFRYPQALAADSSGNVYVADSGNSSLRKISPGGVVTTVATGIGNASGLAVDGSGNVYASAGHAILKITTTGAFTVFAGGGAPGYVDGNGSASAFNSPSGLAIDGSGNVYVADYWNSAIRKIAPNATVTTLAGLPADRGSADGAANAARFNQPFGIAADGAGNLYIADTFNHTIRKITTAGVVSTIAGLAGMPGSADGAGSAARFNQPVGLVVDPDGIVYVAEAANHTIRKITADGTVTTLAGLAGSSGSADGTGAAARFYDPIGIAILNGDVYVSDTGNHTIRKITAAGVVTTFAGLAGNGTSIDGTGSGARFYFPYGLATDATGNFYVTENRTVRKITPAAVVTTLAGSAGAIGSADGTGSAARFGSPVSGVATDTSGNIYVADMGNGTIRRVSPAGVVTTIGGVPMVDLNAHAGCNDGTGPDASFWAPAGVATDASGAVYVCEIGSKIRVGRPALPDSAVIDLPSGIIGASRQLDTLPQSATAWQWSVVRQPSASAASLSSASIRNPTFTPDIAELYEFRLVATNASGSSITTVKLLAGAALPKGDASGDGAVSVADIFYLINNLFAGGPAPVGPADVNADGSVGVADVFYLINYLFAAGTAPM